MCIIYVHRALTIQGFEGRWLWGNGFEFSSVSLRQKCYWCHFPRVSIKNRQCDACNNVHSDCWGNLAKKTRPLSDNSRKVIVGPCLKSVQECGWVDVSPFPWYLLHLNSVPCTVFVQCLCTLCHNQSVKVVIIKCAFNISHAVVDNFSCWLCFVFPTADWLWEHERVAQM